MRRIACCAFVLCCFLFAGCSDDSPIDPDGSTGSGQLPPPISLKWSPAGDWIVYLEAGKMKVTKTDGSGEGEIISGQGGYEGPVWSPDGTRLAFHHAPYMATADIWVSEPLTMKTPVRITDNIRADELPTWSPDGEQIAFQTSRQGNRDIWIVDANGYRTPFAFTTDPAHDEHPAWSPNGEQIAFSSRRTGVSNIWIQPVDGDDTTAWQLTDNGESDTFPIWSPDGSQIAYLSKRSGLTYLWVVDVVPGGSTRRVSITSGIRAPNWSPDGQFLVFESDTTAWMVRADGQGKQINIVDGLEPIWSPRGDRIAFVYWDETRYRIGFQPQSTDLDWWGDTEQ